MALAERYPGADIQSSRHFERVVMMDAHVQINEKNEAEIKKNFNSVAPKLVQQHCVKQDEQFRKYFGLDGAESAGEPAANQHDQAKSLSLLRQKGRR